MMEYCRYPCFLKFIMRMEIAAGVTPIPFGKVVEDRKKP
jgi:hypothetical protein